MKCPLSVAVFRTVACVAAVLATMSSPASAASDPGWPRTYTTPTGAWVQVHEPQIASWDDQRRLVAYVAVAHRRRTGEAPVLGALKFEADTAVSLDVRQVRLDRLTIAEASFAGLDRDRTRQILADVERALLEYDRVIALDRILAGLDASRIRPQNVAGVKADPPAIVMSTTPAVLVNIDGAPIWSPIPGTDLKYVVNTNWDVFEHAPSRTLYLRHGEVWLAAAALDGSWRAAGTLPASFSRLPADANWNEVRASFPGRRLTSDRLPRVFVSTSPAELILLRGAPSYVMVAAGSELLWVNNTESDVFRMGRTGRVYYLVAGRWFSAPDFTGPWTFATPALPADFQRIGAGHPRARVLASVPGTAQAAEAVVLAQIPQTAKVSRKTLPAPAVTYVGAPQFQAIERTTVARAVNTDKDVLRIGDLYYLCFQGVWFVSTNPSGPWQVAASVPAAVHAIPASSPAHHVTYVTVVDADDDWVTYAARAGYSGVTIAWGCAVWGTGWYYPPYVGYAGVYPVYYPYYATYGAAAWYNPWSGAYQRGAVAYGPYGGAGAAARYNPATGTYARGAMAWGPNGATGAAQAYNPRTGGYAQTRQEAGVYGSWGSSYVQRGDDWAQTTRATSNVTGATGRVTRTDEGAMISGRGANGSGFVAAGEDGVYAGRDGNVYRRAEGGGWQKYENGAWGTTQRPARDGAATAREKAGSAGVGGDGTTLGQLETDRAARADGGQRARDRAANRPSGNRVGSGSRPSGAPRGGGGRRR
jgi:hypothetical protein